VRVVAARGLRGRRRGRGGARRLRVLPLPRLLGVNPHPFPHRVSLDSLEFMTGFSSGARGICLLLAFLSALCEYSSPIDRAEQLGSGTRENRHRNTGIEELSRHRNQAWLCARRHRRASAHEVDGVEADHRRDATMKEMEMVSSPRPPRPGPARRRPPRSRGA